LATSGQWHYALLVVQVEDGDTLYHDNVNFMTTVVFIPSSTNKKVILFNVLVFV